RLAQRLVVLAHRPPDEEPRERRADDDHADDERELPVREAEEHPAWPSPAGAVLLPRPWLLPRLRPDEHAAGPLAVEAELVDHAAGPGNDGWSKSSNTTSPPG